jgi:hypothetical protein
VSPADVSATIFTLLGADPSATFPGRQREPIRLSTGRPIRGLIG